MANISFSCTNCGKKISVPDKLAGKKGKCPGCQAAVTVPAGGAPAGAGTVKKPGGELKVDADPRMAKGGEAVKGKTGVIKPTTKAPSKGPGMAVAAASKTPTKGPGKVTSEPDETAIPPGDDDIPPVADDDDIPPVADDEPEEKKPERGRRAGLASREDRSASRDGAAAAKKSGGGFLWFIFGLLLAVAHTAAAVALGAVLVLMYAEKPSQFPWFAEPAKMLGIQEKLDQLKGGGQAGTAPKRESEPVTGQQPPQ